MWKKNETPHDPAPRPTQPPARQPVSRRSEEVATIGPSITIQGDLTGGEDLLIQGKIEGKIMLKKNNVTVGKEGRVKADIHGRTVKVDGEVRGNLYGEEEVVIRSSGRVQGNLVAPRVTLENGSKFKGAIDMEAAAREKGRPASPRPAERAAERAAERPAERPAERASEPQAMKPEKSEPDDSQSKIETQPHIGGATPAS